MRVMVGIGDSLIQGRVDDAGGGWLNRLVRALESRGMRPEFMNRGRGADTTRKVLSRIKVDCIDLKPDLVVLGVGVNDCRRRASLGNVCEVPLQEFRDNLRQIGHSLSTATNARVVVSGMVPVDDSRSIQYKPDKAHHRSDQPPYEDALREACDAFGFDFLDHYSRWLEKSEKEIASLLYDGVHPNSQGHAEMAEAALHFILERGIV